MTLVIGADEAGYGPKLGPLVISVTAWRLPPQAELEDLYSLVRRSVCKKPPLRGGSKARLAIADSKALYARENGLGQLERGVLALLAAWERPCLSFSDAWSRLAPGATAQFEELPWHRGHEAALPRRSCPQDVNLAAKRVRKDFARAGVEIVLLKSRAVFPAWWNELNQRFASKGDVLSWLTINLLREALGHARDEPVVIVCDKHGGRNRYQAHLQSLLTDRLVEVHLEGRAESVYRWGPPDARVTARFCAKAERFLPVALASMISKYLRELSMEAFNQFWAIQAPLVRPTAGYPGDAERFRSEVDELRAAMKVDDHRFWRQR